MTHDPAPSGPVIDCQPGDIVNGHILTEDAGWVRLAPEAAALNPGKLRTEAPNKTSSGKVAALVTLAAVAFIGVAVVTSPPSSDVSGSPAGSPVDSDVPSSTDAGGNVSTDTGGTDAEGGSGAGAEQSASWQTGYQDTWTMLYRTIATPYTTQKEATVEDWCQTWEVSPLSLTQDGHLYDLDEVEAGCVAAVLERGYGPAFE